MGRGKHRVDYVDGLRGLAALTVVGVHANVYSRSFDPGSTRYEAWAQLTVVVVIFFLISGFVMWLPYARAHAQQRPAPRLDAYALGRVARIAPGYWVALIVAMLMFTAPPNVDGLQQLSWFGLFTTWLPPEHTWQPLGQVWSLDVEILCYFLIPVAAFAAGRAGRRLRSWVARDLVVIGAIAAAAIGWKLAIAATQGPEISVLTPGSFWPLVFVDHFALGMALAVLVVAREQAGGEVRPWIRAAVSPALLWPLWVVVQVVAIWGVTGPDNVTFLSSGGPGHFLAEHALYLASGALLTVPVIVGTAPRPLLALLSSRPIVFLGTVSYGIFLWHTIVQDSLFRAGLPHEASYATWFALSGAFSVLVGWLSYRLVEAPVMKLAKRRMDRDRLEPPAPNLPGPAEAGALARP